MVAYCFLMTTCYQLQAQTNIPKQETAEDTSLGIKPTFKIESLSPAGHCDNQQLSFYAPWADHYEIAKRRSDTAWIKDSKAINTWSYQVLKPNVTGMIYKRLDEQATFQFVIKACKGSRYRLSDTITLKPCMTADAIK